MRAKVAIIISHPIQYYSPLFSEMAKANLIDFRVFYTWSQAKEKVFDDKFGQDIQWDIPLLEGYDYQFIENISAKPSSQYYKGLVNPSLNKEIESYGATSILVVGWNHHSHFRAMKYFKGKIPVYFRGDSTLLDEKFGIKKLIRRVSLKYVYQHVDYAFYVGSHNKDYFLKHGLSEIQLINAPHAIDNHRFYSTANYDYSSAASKRRKELDIKESDIVFLFIGKFEPKKNPTLLMEAATRNENFIFIFIGAGELEGSLRKLALKHKNIKFLPFQNQSVMPEVYRLGQFCVLPSRSETWGLVVNEAMACSLAIIASDKVGCAPDLVIEGKTGHVFKDNDLDDLCSKLKLAAKNHQVIGENALTHIKQFDIQSLSSAMLTAFQ
jgi:glycosyltransferase involved in cell wall biosynthesis